MTKPLQLWLSRQRNGLYMLTMWKPLRYEVGSSGEDDFYIAHGEPFGLRNLCEFSAKALFGVVLKIGKSVKVELGGATWKHRK